MYNKIIFVQFLNLQVLLKSLKSFNFFKNNINKETSFVIAPSKSFGCKSEMSYLLLQGVCSSEGGQVTIEDRAISLAVFPVWLQHTYL